jgi:5'-nucleotidase
VASGVNHGSNLGDDVTYSGTVSAAMEGTLLGVPSIAVSLVDGGDFAVAARVARLVAMRVLVEGLAPQTLLNVNVPGEAPRGIRFTRLGQRVYGGKVVEQSDPRGRAHYWLGGGPPQWEALDGTDMGAVHEGFVSVTPVHLDLTNHRGLALMADWASALDGQWRRPAATKAPKATNATKPARRARPRRR